MPEPIAVCLEDLSPSPGAPRFVRCVAVSGALPGLRVSPRGELLWKSDGDAACELWVSADERLILRRPEGAPEVRVSRAGRSIVAPVGKPVVLVDGDELEVGSKHLRVHLHGKAPSVHAPAPLDGWSTAGRVAAVVAMGAAVAGCKPGIEVRDNPPSVAVLPVDASEPPQADAPDAAIEAEAEAAPIEVREMPPAPMPDPTVPNPPAPKTGPGRK